MTLVINALRVNNFSASRTLADPNRTAPDPFRWGSDALEIGGTIYDIYLSWPSPANPQAVFHGNGRGEVTSDLYALGGGPSGDPKLGVCLRSKNQNYIFYREDSDRIRIDLSSMEKSRRAVAIDTKKVYEEIPLGSFSAVSQTWVAPYASDWVVAVGDFSGQTNEDLTLNLIDVLYRSALLRKEGPDFPGADGWVDTLRSMALNGAEEVAGFLAESEEFKSKISGLSSVQVVSRLFSSLLDREPDPEGRDYFTAMIDSGKVVEVIKIIVRSAEYKEKAVQKGWYYNDENDLFARNLVDQLYRQVLFREQGADFPGAQGYVDIIKASELKAVVQVAEAFVETEEFKERVKTMTDEEILERFYLELFGRRVDESGKQSWLPLIKEKKTALLLKNLIMSNEFRDVVYRKNGRSARP
jgi:hypothetical protein